MKNAKHIRKVFFFFFLLVTCKVFSQDPFITTWQTTVSNESITIPTFPSETYNYTVDWGDGSAPISGYTGDATYAYTTPGTYTVSVTGDFPRIYFNNPSVSPAENSTKILTIEQWGDIQWSSMEGAFMGCSNLTGNFLDIPNLSNVTSTVEMFHGCENFNSDINNWDVSTVNTMASMFSRARAFNQDLDNWNVGSVTDMGGMFVNARSFNGDISTWDCLLYTSPSPRDA